MIHDPGRFQLLCNIQDTTVKGCEQFIRFFKRHSDPFKGVGKRQGQVDMP